MPFLLLNTSAGLPSDLTPWIVLGIALIGLGLVFLRPKMKKKDPMEESPKLSLAQQRSVERQMSNLLIELAEMSRQITAQLDTRAAKLEALIKEADEKAAELKSLMTKQGQSPEATTPPPSRSRLVEPDDEAAAPLHFEPPDPRYEQVYMLADQGRSPVEIARKLDRPSGEIELILALRPKI